MRGIPHGPKSKKQIKKGLRFDGHTQIDWFCVNFGNLETMAPKDSIRNNSTCAARHPNKVRTTLAFAGLGARLAFGGFPSVKCAALSSHINHTVALV